LPHDAIVECSRTAVPHNLTFDLLSALDDPTITGSWPRRCCCCCCWLGMW